MASNSDEMVPQVQDDFQNLLAYVTGPDARVRTAYTVELTRFRRLLALGAPPCGRRRRSPPLTERVCPLTISVPRPTTRSLGKCPLGGTPSPPPGRGESVRSLPS
jgi:hypothetical protein